MQLQRLASNRLRGQRGRVDAVVDTIIILRAREGRKVQRDGAASGIVGQPGGLVACSKKAETHLPRAYGERAEELQLATADGGQRLRAVEGQLLVVGYLRTHSCKAAVGALDELSAGINTDLTRQREQVGIAHLIVGLRGQFVGDDAHEERLVAVAIDGGREQAVAVATDAAEFQRLNASGIGLEVAVGVDAADPAEGSYAYTCA